MAKKEKRIVIIIFLICLMFPVLFVNRENGVVSTAENRYLAEFPEPFSRAGFEAWISDNIGFRNAFLDIYANIMYHILGLSPSDKIVIGKEGWLFYNGENNLKIADGKYPLTEEDLAGIVNGQEKIRDHLKKRDCEYFLILPPSKVSIYYEYLRGNYHPTQTPVDLIERELKEQTDINVINLRDCLLKAKEKEQVYLKTDTHWNQIGAYEAYKEIHKRLFPQEDMPKTEVYDTKVKGEFSNMMGSPSLLKEEETGAIRILDPDAELILEKDGMEYVYHNDNGNGKTCLMFGDSMFGGNWNIRELLAEDFTDYIFIWSYDIDEDKIDKYSPDIVFYDMAERFLDTLDSEKIT